MTDFALKFICFLILSITLSGCNPKAQQSLNDSSHAYTNKLIHTSSPYLLQHAHNPVDWYPWGEEALAKAKKEDKLLIISIGYAACHWCHVMEHESFEDTAVANLMNDHFVSIKIDREERPDIDQIYMNAAMMMNGRGGWPLNAIALPDGRPIFAGTYFPNQEWKRILGYFKDIREKEPEKVEQQAEGISRGINRINFTEIVDKPDEFPLQATIDASQSLLQQVDMKKGGMTGAPKFPMPVIYLYLLEHYYHSEDKKVLEAVETTLKSMHKGGIYDHLAGGFARYSTDDKWKVPHFEKMLYDNGQLVSLYARAYQLTKDPEYKKVVEETLEWVKQEMTDSNGGFYSSLDADSEGEEGKFYVWEAAEIDSVLGEDAKMFNEYFEVSGRGNWEEKNILYITQDAKDIASKYKMTEKAFGEKIDELKSKLLQARASRVRPGLDDKILTAWNALMIKGYVDAYQVLGNQAYLDAAIKNAKFLQANALRKDGGLNRNFKDGKSAINAFADDYSLLIEAFVALYQATFEEKWLMDAQQLMEYALLHFFDEGSGNFYYTSDEDPALIARTKELQDNVIPSSNSSFGKALYALGTYLDKADYKEKAAQILAQALPNIAESARFYSNYSLLLNSFVHEPYEVAIVGDDWHNKLTAWNQEYHPNVLLLGGKEEGSLELLQNKRVPGATFIYVCQNKVCKLPVEKVDKALMLVTND